MSVYVYFRPKFFYAIVTNIIVYNFLSLGFTGSPPRPIYSVPCRYVTFYYVNSFCCNDKTYVTLF